MTSYIRNVHNTAATNTVDYVRVSGPYYSDSLIGSTLIPFIYDNGVLDIANIDNFNSYTGIPLMDSDLGIYTLSLYKLLGGGGLVRTLGANFIRYIRNWRSTSTTAPVTKVELYTNAIMTKIQRSPKSVLYSGSVVRINASPPSGDLYIEGDDNVNYRTTWIFKKPLTITTVEDGVTKYITFTSTLY
jgi:hypothetical protein